MPEMCSRVSSLNATSLSDEDIKELKKTKNDFEDWFMYRYEIVPGMPNNEVNQAPAPAPMPVPAPMPAPPSNNRKSPGKLSSNAFKMFQGSSKPNTPETFEAKRKAAMASRSNNLRRKATQVGRGRKSRKHRRGHKATRKNY